MDKSSKSSLEGIIHCPVCGRELGNAKIEAGGWKCKCGEFIPKGLTINSFEGCTHGLNCNCGRKMRR